MWVSGVKAAAVGSKPRRGRNPAWGGDRGAAREGRSGGLSEDWRARRRCRGWWPVGVVRRAGPAGRRHGTDTLARTRRPRVLRGLGGAGEDHSGKRAGGRIAGGMGSGRPRGELVAWPASARRLGLLCSFVV